MTVIFLYNCGRSLKALYLTVWPWLSDLLTSEKRKGFITLISHYYYIIEISLIKIIHGLSDLKIFILRVLGPYDLQNKHLRNLSKSFYSM